MKTIEDIVQEKLKISSKSYKNIFKTELELENGEILYFPIIMQIYDQHAAIADRIKKVTIFAYRFEENDAGEDSIALYDENQELVLRFHSGIIKNLFVHHKQYIVKNPKSPNNWLTIKFVQESIKV